MSSTATVLGVASAMGGLAAHRHQHPYGALSARDSLSLRVLVRLLADILLYLCSSHGMSWSIVMTRAATIVGASCIKFRRFGSYFLIFSLIFSLRISFHH